MVNANQARPLVAFWLLAVAAGAITAIGLLEDDPGGPNGARHPSRVTASAAPDVVLGGVLRAQPSPRLTSALSPDLWEPATAVATAVPVLSPATATGRHKVRAEAVTTVHHGTGGKTHGGTQTTSTPTATSTSGHGKGHQKSGGSGKTATTTSATITSGHGGGRPSDRGKGH